MPCHQTLTALQKNMTRHRLVQDFHKNYSMVSVYNAALIFGSPNAIFTCVVQLNIHADCCPDPLLLVLTMARELSGGLQILKDYITRLVTEYERDIEQVYERGGEQHELAGMAQHNECSTYLDVNMTEV